jgi:hypothetical protein
MSVWLPTGLCSMNHRFGRARRATRLRNFQGPCSSNPADGEDWRCRDESRYSSLDLKHRGVTAFNMTRWVASASGHAQEALAAANDMGMIGDYSGLDTGK